MPQPAFEHSQVVYYTPSEYLPPIDTRTERALAPRKADPELSRQPIISLPREADNRSQTIVTPANIKLARDVAVPNIVAWSDTVKPRLDIPPVPLTPAAEITRTAPAMNSVVAPPSDIRESRSLPVFNAPQPALIAPPPSVETARTRTLGDLNIGHSAVINPAPQLGVGEQRAIPGRSSAFTGMAPQVVAPPSALAVSSSSGARGRVIALSLHPAIGAPPQTPEGNRRGAFAAAPEGRTGASGAPGSSSGASSSGVSSSGSGNGSGSGLGKKAGGDMPSGLYVGSAPAKTSPVAGNPGGASANRVNPSLAANVRPSRTNTASTLQSGDAAKLSEAERAVFAGRKFYSVTLNMPNLNSAGGSWIIRFAEKKRDSDYRRAERAPADDLAQPTATKKVDPGYPIQLMRENVAGTVILYAVIHADGTVGDVRVLRSVDDRLDQRASEALAQWQFHPATKNGAPVEVEATFQIPFKPARVGTNF